jgi:hypothetical protein
MMAAGRDLPTHRAGAFLYRLTVRLREVLRMKRWRVGDVQRLGAVGGAGETWGVALYDETGKPCVTFGYPKETDAKAGREHIKAALIGVASVTKVQG